MAADATTWSVELEYPVAVNGTRFEKLDFRRPKAKDLKKMGAKSNKSEVDKTFGMLADLGSNGLGPTDFEELDASDFMRVQEVLGEILGVERQTTPG